MFQRYHKIFDRKTVYTHESSTILCSMDKLRLIFLILMTYETRIIKLNDFHGGKASANPNKVIGWAINEAISGFLWDKFLKWNWI